MVVHNNILAGASGTTVDAGPYKINRSLRFNDDDASSLRRTISSSGNLKTYTLSMWVKRSKLGYLYSMLYATNGTNGIYYQFKNTDKLEFADYYGASYQFQLVTSRVFRDTSAWYHIVVAVDTTQSTASDRVKIYVNGVQETNFDTENYPAQNYEGSVNRASIVEDLGDMPVGGDGFNGYLADVHLLDGQAALAPTDFGEYDDNNVWQPKEYSGSYGTNGFHLDFSDPSDLGNDKAGSNNWTPNNLVGTGVSNPASVLNLPLNATPFADSSASSATVTNTGSISTTSAATNSFNISTVASLDGSSQRLNTNNSNISFQNKWTIDSYFIIDSGASGYQLLFNSGYGSQTSNYMYIGIDNTDKPYVETTSSGSRTTAANAINKNQWYHMRVIQKDGSITMYLNGTSVLTKTAQTTDLSSAGSNTIGSALDNGNNANNFSGHLGPFRIVNDALDVPPSGGTATSSGTLSNNGTITDGPSIDSLIDTPMNYEADSGNNGGNYCTLNPLDNGGLTLSDGNLTVSRATNSHRVCRAGIGITSGKYYWEYTLAATTNSTNSSCIGIAKADAPLDNSYVGETASGWAFYSANGQKVTSDSWSSYGSGMSNGDTIGVAFDADNGTLAFYQNGSSLGNAFTGLTSGPYFPALSLYGTQTYHFNFGQRPFKYTPPTGYKSLCTQNLPDPTIADGSTAFDVALFTGNGSSQTISGLGFSPDLVWTKLRSIGFGHRIWDTVRGATKRLEPHATTAEATEATALTAFTSDGFSVGAESNVNLNNGTPVAFVWDAGSSNTSISAGSLNSSAYNQSQNWTNLITFNAGGWNGNGTAPFDADAANYDYGNTTRANNGYATLDISSLTGSRVISVTSEQTEVTITHDGGTTTYTPTTTSRLTHTFAAVTNPTSIKFDGLNSSSVFVLVGVTVDGARLVNSGVTPPNFPSIASTVRANPSAGFSIVTGSGNSGTVGHGLNAKPDLVIVKQRNGAVGWAVTHSALGTMKDNIIYLNGTGANTNSSNFWGSSNFDSTVFPISSNICTSGATFVAYCFTAVSGYSSFGKFTGNGSADGPFVYTGFKIKWLMIKRTDSTSNWFIIDASRSPYNEVNDLLYAELSNSETSNDTNNGIDFLSNGFKLRKGAGGTNINGATLIYCAFADNPFKTSRAN